MSKAARTAAQPHATGTQRLRFLLAASLAGVYFTLVMVMALAPARLASALNEAGTVSVGMLAALVMILLVFAVMAAFVGWIDGRTRSGR